MSIIRMVTRLCAVAALRERTWAGDRVYNSDNTPLAQALEAGQPAKPYIVVFTDADNRTDISATEVYGSNRNLSLVLEIAIASVIKGTNGIYQIDLPATDAGMETALDIVEAQAIGAILGDPLSRWGEILRLLISEVVRMPSVRGAQAARGARWAARQVTLVCNTIFDMPPGVPYPNDPEADTVHPVWQFINQSRMDPQVGMSEYADIIEKVITNTAGPSWEQEQAWLGLTRRGMRATGWAPLAELPEGATPRPVELPVEIVMPDGSAPEFVSITLEQEDDTSTQSPEQYDPKAHPPDDAGDTDYYPPNPPDPKPFP